MSTRTPTRRQTSRRGAVSRSGPSVLRVRPRPRRWLWAAVAVVVVVALLGWLVWFSPVLVARHVEVEGARDGQAQRVREAAEVPLGTPLVDVDLAAVVDRVLATGDIAQTTVNRSWPSTVVVQVTPRRAVLVLDDPQGEVQVVDRHGVAYEPVAEPPKRLPRVELVGVNGDDRQTALGAAAEALQLLPDRLRHRVDEVRVDGREDVTFVLGDLTVHWGVGGDSRLKAEVLTALLRADGDGLGDHGRAARQGSTKGPGRGEDRPLGDLRRIDVSAPRQPVVE